MEYITPTLSIPPPCPCLIPSEGGLQLLYWADCLPPLPEGATVTFWTDFETVKGDETFFSSEVQCMSPPQKKMVRTVHEL